MHWLLVILVASSTADVFVPTGVFTLAFDSHSTCETVGGWVQNERVKAQCFPAQEAMWEHGGPRAPIEIVPKKEKSP